MILTSKRLNAVFAALVALNITNGLSNALAQDVAHWVTGVVKRAWIRTPRRSSSSWPTAPSTPSSTPNDTVVKGSKDAAKGTEKKPASIPTLPPRPVPRCL